MAFIVMLVLALVAIIEQVMCADVDAGNLVSGIVSTQKLTSGQSIIWKYDVNDFDSRMDFYFNYSNDAQQSPVLVATLSYFTDEEDGQPSKEIILSQFGPDTTTAFTLPDTITQSGRTTALNMQLKVTDTKKVSGNTTINMYLYDGVFLPDDFSTNNMKNHDFIGDTRYYKFFVCDSNENVTINVTVSEGNPDLKVGDVYLYVSTAIGQPNETNCGTYDCLLKQSMTDYENTFTLDASKFAEPGWLFAGLRINGLAKSEEINDVGLMFENMDHIDPPDTFPHQTEQGDLCLYEHCTLNFKYKVNKEQNLAVSAWNDDYDRMLLDPLKITAAIHENMYSNAKKESAEGFVYFTAEELQELFSGDDDTTFYFRVNNQRGLHYPSMGEEYLSPVRFGLCQNCTPLYPHGTKYAFFANTDEWSRSKFIIPFAYDSRSEPEYITPTYSKIDYPNLRPVYSFTFRNYNPDDPNHNSPDTVVNKCPWNFVASTTYTYRDADTDEQSFDVYISENSAHTGGASRDVAYDTASNQFKQKFYREEMTLFAHMYPQITGGSPKTCQNDVNYLYVGDTYEMNPEFIDEEIYKDGNNNPFETEMSYEAREREREDEYGYYPMHVRVTLTGSLTKEGSDNFRISVIPQTSGDNSILIVGSCDYSLPDPDYDRTYVSNGGTYTSNPYISINGRDAVNNGCTDAIYFTINFLTPSKVNVKFTREEKILIQNSTTTISSTFTSGHYLLGAHYTSGANDFNKAFFAAIITNTLSDSSASNGVKFCINEDMTTKPKEDCSGASNSMEISNLSTGNKSHFLRTLNDKMTSSLSYVRVTDHSTAKNQNEEAKFNALFATYIELDGADIENDVQDFMFDEVGSPIFFKFVSSQEQDNLIRLKPNGTMGKDGATNPNILVYICPSFPAITEDYPVSSNKCQTVKVNANDGLQKYIKFSKDSAALVGDKTELWCTLFPHSIKAGAKLTVDFSQSTMFSETEDNLVPVSSSSISYYFGEIPKITVDDGSVSSTQQYIIEVTGLNATGEFYYSQTEIHPTRQSVPAQYVKTWPENYKISLAKSTTKRIYFGFKLDGSSSKTSRVARVKVNFVYSPEFSLEATENHPTISLSDPLFSFYDVTPAFGRTIPHNAVSFYFYPYNTSDDTINFDTDIFADMPSFDIYGGNDIDDVNTQDGRHPYKSNGKGIHIVTLPIDEIAPDKLDGKNHAYFSAFMESDKKSSKVSATDPSATVVTTIFDIVSTSFTLSPDAPITDNIIANDDYFEQDTNLEYVPIYLNYNATTDEDVTVKILIETCVLNPLNNSKMGKHRFYYSQYKHNPGPDDKDAKYFELGDLNDDRTFKLDGDFKKGYNTFYSLHSGVDSYYQFSILLSGKDGEYKDKRPSTSLSHKIGYKNFEASKSVTLEVNPMFGYDGQYAELGVYYFETSKTNIAYNNACGFLYDGNAPLLVLSGNDIPSNIDKETGLVSLNIDISKLTNDVEYYMNIVAVYKDFNNAYTPVKIIPNKGLSAVEIDIDGDDGSSSSWWVWLIIILAIVIVGGCAAFYVLYWRPRSIEFKQYQELDEKATKVDDGGAIELEDERDEVLV